MMSRKMSLVKFAAVVFAAVTVAQATHELLRNHTAYAQQSFGDNPESFPIPSSLPEGTTLRVDGSTSMQLTNEALESRFEAQYPDIDVELEASRTDQAIEDLLAGSIDLVASGRPLTEAEKEEGLAAIALEREKLAIILGPDNAFEGELSFEQFAQIFRGEITNWSEVGGPDLPIRFVDRPDYSDTRRALSTYTVFEGGPFATGATADPVAEDETDAVIAELGADGIGYAVVSQVSGRDDVQILSMHQTLPDDPRYPYSQYRSFVYREDASPATLAFLGFARTAPGQEVIVAAPDADAADAGAPDAGEVDADATADADGVEPATTEPATTIDPEKAPSKETVLRSTGVDIEAEGGGFPWWLLLLLGIPLVGGLLWWLLKGKGDDTAAVGTTPPPVTPVASVPPPPSASPGTGEAGVTANGDLPVGDGVSGNRPATGTGNGSVGTGINLPGAAVGGAAIAGAAAIGAAGLAGKSGADDTDESDDIPTDSPPPPTVPPVVPMGDAGLPDRGDLPTTGDVAAPEPPTDAGGAGVNLPGAAIGGAAIAGAAAIGAAGLAGKSGTDDTNEADETSTVPPVAPVPLGGDVDTDAKGDTDEASVDPPAEPPVIPIAPKGDVEAVDTGIRLPGLAMGGAAIAAGGAAIGAAGLMGTGTDEADATSAPVPPSRITLMPQTNKKALAQWEVPDAAKAAAKTNGGKTYQLQVCDVTDIDVTQQPPHSVLTYDVAETDSDRIVPIPDPNRDYIAAIGYQTEADTWINLARSEPMRSTAIFSAAMADSTTGLGVAAVGADVVGAGVAAATAEQADSSTITLTPRTAQMADATWSVPPTRKIAAKQEGGEAYQLRLYDVTGIDMDVQAPHRMDKFPCDETIDSLEVPIPQTDRDYLVEVGYEAPGDRWLQLARSTHIYVPAEGDVTPTDGLGQIGGLAIAGAGAFGAGLAAATAGSSQCAIQTVKVHSRHHAYQLDEAQMSHLQDAIATTYTFTPGLHILRIREGVFRYDGNLEHPGEPWVLLWIYGGTVINQKTGVPVSATWSTLNGYADTLTLDVKEPATLCAFFFDTYPEDNTGEVTLSVIQL
ncbi:MAG: DUF4912 domain-containing protein [Cyanobacteria bacterium J06638_20]